MSNPAMFHSPEPSTLAAARDRYIIWLRESRDASRHTVRAYGCDVAALIAELPECRHVNELSPEAIQLFFEHQRSMGLRPATLRRRAAAIRGFCRFLREQGLAGSMPWPSSDVVFRRSQTLPRAVPHDTLTRLVDYLIREAGVAEDLTPDAPLSNPIAATTLVGTSLMLATGVRVGELVSLRTCDIEFAERSVQVLGKGRRERIVYLTDDWLAHLVRAYLQTRICLGIEHERLLFNSRRSPLSEAGVRARLAVASINAGLGRRVTPHMLRHSAATQLIESGVNIRFVQVLLGHASLATTEIYTHVTDQALREAVSAADVLRRTRR